MFRQNRYLLYPMFQNNRQKIRGGKQMIDQKTYDELEERYGQVASWALWEPGVEGAKPSINSKK